MAEANAREVSWFARPAVQFAVMAPFFLLTVPLSLLIVANDAVWEWMPLYGVTAGFTHFVITGAMYLDSRNLRYFGSTRRNQLVYFGVPLFILLSMDWLAASGTRAQSAALDNGLFLLVMGANFLHVSRQSFGVLQLFKREAGGDYTSSLRSLENLFFLALVGLQFQTLLFGEAWPAGNWGAEASAALAGLLYAAVALVHLRIAWPQRGQRAAWVPLAYFSLQALSGALAVWRTGFYTLALAMHYVEYHVIMVPRVFDAPVDPSSRIDRLRSRLTHSRVLFYAGLLSVTWSLWFVQRSQAYNAPIATSLPLGMLLHAVDGLFLTHFFVEAFVWKFSKGHYRETLGPIYFAPRQAEVPRQASH